MLGAVTTGNATLIAMDGDPVLATDPWIGDHDPAYFGSWTLSHAIPSEQRDLIAASRYHWYSHGHPDHLNAASMARFTGKEILLPDHVGARISTALRADGLSVTVLPERQWVELSPRVRVMCISDHLQDAILLVDVGGTVFVDMNDAGARGCKRFIRSVVEGFDQSYLLKLSGYGDADMINLLDEEGVRIDPFRDRRPVVGQVLSGWATTLGCNHAIPFSSFHRYQRSDSVWANQHTTPVAAHAEGFDERAAAYVPPFATIDAERGPLASTPPPTTPEVVLAPEAFGDDWSDDLEADDRVALDRYFGRIDAVRRRYGFVAFEVGATRHVTSLDGPSTMGITFSVPRSSLMTAVRHQVFDDLLIGNFMRTQLHGGRSLYDPDFALAVAKYADNGGVAGREEVDAYLRTYRARAEGEWLRERFDTGFRRMSARYLTGDNPVLEAGRRVYRKIR